MSDIHQFIVVDDLFERYTVIVQIASRHTSVYCDECDMWVAEWPDEQLTTQSTLALYERILDNHKQDFPEPVEFSETDFYTNDR